jgi:hypothetical protein
MFLAAVSVRRVEDITEALWGTRCRPRPEMIEPQVDEVEATTGIDIKTVTADPGYAYAKV